jgi:hypothetical protein
MKRQLQQQQTLRHMMDVAKNQSTIVKAPPVEPTPEQPVEEIKPIEPEVTPEPVKLEVTGSETKSSKK